MALDLSGVVVPVITPIADDGTVEYDRIPAAVEYALERGCQSVISSGTGVQDLPALSPEERKADISGVIEAVDGRVPVVAGVSYPADDIVEDLIDHAEAEGAEALIGTPPWGATPHQETIIQYFDHMADYADRPVFVYNNPGLSTEMTRETLRRVADHDNVRWVKESGHDWKKIAWLIDQLDRAGRAEMFTTMEVFLPTLQAGGTGVVTPAPTNLPCMRLWTAYQEGDLDTAAEIQQELSLFPPPEAQTGGAAIWKAAATADGFDIGGPREPHDPVTDRDIDALQGWLERMGINE